MPQQPDHPPPPTIPTQSVTHKLDSVAPHSHLSPQSPQNTADPPPALCTRMRRNPIINISRLQFCSKTKNNNQLLETPSHLNSIHIRFSSPALHPRPASSPNQALPPTPSHPPPPTSPPQSNLPTPHTLLPPPYRSPNPPQPPILSSQHLHPHLQRPNTRIYEMDNHPDVSPREDVERVRATSAPEDIVLVAEEEALFEEALVVHRLRC